MSVLMLYILIRTDMVSMKYGKGSAQAVHAGNAFTDKHIIEKLLKNEQPETDVSAWRASTSQGFGTTITLNIPNLETLETLVDIAGKLNFKSDIITDPSYPYFVDKELVKFINISTHTLPPIVMKDKVLCFREEKTCGYIFGEKKLLEILLKQFDLLSNE